MHGEWGEVALFLLLPSPLLTSWGGGFRSMVGTLLFLIQPWLKPAVLRYGYCNACEAKRFLTDGTPRPLKLRRLLQLK